MRINVEASRNANQPPPLPPPQHHAFYVGNRLVSLQCCQLAKNRLPFLTFLCKKINPSKALSAWFNCESDT
jgi:hypothetical protein